MSGARLGAPPKGAAHVDAIDGSELAKERTKTILRLLAGELTRAGAAEELGVSVRRVRQLRETMLVSAVAALEPGRGGPRPNPAPTEEERRIAELEAEADMLAWELKTARVAEELAVVMPSLGVRGEPTDGARGKRRASRTSRAAGAAGRSRPKR